MELESDRDHTEGEHKKDVIQFLEASVRKKKKLLLFHIRVLLYITDSILYAIVKCLDIILRDIV